MNGEAKDPANMQIRVVSQLADNYKAVTMHAGRSRGDRCGQTLTVSVAMKSLAASLVDLRMLEVEENATSCTKGHASFSLKPALGAPSRSRAQKK